MNTQPEALRLADELEAQADTFDIAAAAELRRLHALNAEMLEAANQLIDGLEYGGRILGNRNAPPKLIEVMAWLASSESAITQARAVIAKAEGRA